MDLDLPLPCYDDINYVVDKKRSSEGEIHSDISGDDLLVDDFDNKLLKDEDSENKDKERRMSKRSSSSREHSKHRRSKSNKRRHHRRHRHDHDRRKSSKKSRYNNKDINKSSHHHRRSRSRKDHRSRSTSSSSSSRSSYYSTSSRSSRSRSRSRDRSHRKSSRRSHHHRNRNKSNDSYNSEHDYSDSGNWHHDKSGPNESYKFQEPNTTIMIRGMSYHLTEFDIRQEILKSGYNARDIRLIRDRETGESRGFAFVEFNSLQEATKWMEYQKGVITMQEQYQANLIYSVTKGYSSLQGSRVALSDWFCLKCQAHNFKRREVCYKCGASKPDGADFELNDETCQYPTNTIIISNLDMLTTEDGVLQSFQDRPNLSSIAIRSVKVSREPVTNISRGVCYVEANNVADAMKIYAELLRDPFEIESKIVIAAYARLPSQNYFGGVSSTNSSIAESALAAAKWSNNSNSTDLNQTMDETERLAQYSASLYAKNKEDYERFLVYYRDYYKNQEKLKAVESVFPAKKLSDSSGAAVQIQNYGEGGGNKSTTGFSENSRNDSKGAFKQQPNQYSGNSIIHQQKNDLGGGQDIPDKSRYQYDESCGYYYDPVTNLYYDPTTQYFYDSKKSQFLYWDADSQQYKAVMNESTSQNQPEKEKNKWQAVSESTAGDKDKVKVAKKVVKEMEKWARSLNQKKDFSKIPQILNETDLSIPSYAVIGKSEFNPNPFVQKTSTVITTANANPVSLSSLITYDENLSDEEKDEMIKFQNIIESASVNHSSFSPIPISIIQQPPIEEKFVADKKIACLLCKRQFPNQEVHQKHIEFSDLHKNNLMELELRQQNQIASSSIYRDRAKERRQKVGSEIQTKNTLKDMYLKAKSEITPVPTVEPISEGISDNNIGKQLLQKLGWREGSGLGINNQGRTDIIHVEKRGLNTGLGADTGMLANAVNDEDDRVTRTRKLTLARYQDLNQHNTQ